MKLPQIHAEQKLPMGHQLPMGHLLLPRTAIQLPVHAHLIRGDPTREQKSSTYPTTIVVAC